MELPLTGGFSIPEFPHCSNVLVTGLNLQNAHFWTNHLYQCDHVKYLNCRIYSPASPIKAPSTDAIDIDVCHDVLVKNCYLEVNDDSIVLKGGKGPWADTAPENGINDRALKGLLGSLLHMQPEEILSVEIMNPIVIGEAIQDKEFRLDIKAVLNNYQQINLEMQVVNYHDWPERSIGYRTAQDLQ